MNKDDLEKKSLDILLEEYKTLRQESMNTIGYRVTIVGYASAKLAIVGSVTASSSVPEIVIAFTLGLFVPVLAKTVVMVWIGEYKRSQRAGAAIARLEQRINVKLGEVVLCWESDLRRNKTKIVGPYKDVINVFMIISIVSVFSSNYYFFRATQHYIFHDMKHVGQMAVATLITLVFASMVLYIESVSRINVRREWNDSYYFATPEGIRGVPLASEIPAKEIDRAAAAKAFFIFHLKFTSRVRNIEDSGWRSLAKIWEYAASLVRRRKFS